MRTTLTLDDDVAALLKRMTVRTRRGPYVRWRRDGRELFYYYYANDGRLMAVPITDSTALELGAAVPLFEPHTLNGPTTATGFRQQFDVANDGPRFLLNVPVEDASASSPITVVLNWQSALGSRER